jgi:D-amino-acid dehydrogenase
VFYPDDAHLDSGKLYSYLLDYLKKQGVQFHLNESLQSIGFEKNTIQSIRFGKEEIPTDHLVVAAGAWSGELSKQLGLKVPMMGGKGYTFWQDNTPPVHKASILVEARVSVSPYGDRIRFGGTMEIAGTNTTIDPHRLQGIFESINKYYPGFQSKPPVLEEVWSGLRPCSPDGMPYIGKSDKWTNLYMATGHSMMGLSLAPATGMIIRDLLMKHDSPVPLKAFHPDRFA